ncbi:MAG: DUF624 domain-containing protein [Tyzzerella sp.]|nr:DUF624 domain-containing protein [Tyzzerella sp.]
MGIFSLDNAFGRFMDKVWKWTVLNFLCLICSIPIVTIGPAATALYYVTLKMVRGEDTGIIKRYFHAFKQNFKKAFVIHLMMLLAATIILLNLYYCNQLQSEYELYKYWRYVLYVAGAIYIMVITYVYPLLSAYENTVWGTLKNALLLPIAHIGWTVLMMVISILPLYLCYINITIMKWGIFFYFLCGFAVVAFIHSKIFVRIFVQYSKIEQESSNMEVQNED